MFSFHKPKVYRSPTGCCICKAKSSSSRFTDSAKYEEDFIACFLLTERRTGEICNACVLLVKRWKKLPPGSDRNWQHVVDARAGPGIKSLTKFKSKNKKKLKENVEKIEKIVKKKHVYVKPNRCRVESPAMSDDQTAEEYPPNTGSKGSSRTDSPAVSDETAVGQKRPNEDSGVSDWIDLTYFKRVKVCCGTIFKGPYNEVIIDPSLMKPCLGCIARRRAQQQRRADAPGSSPAHSLASASPAHSSASASPAHSVDSGAETAATKPLGKNFSDCSSDSGYDESSNPGIGESKIAKINQTARGANCDSGGKPVHQQPQDPIIVDTHPVVNDAQLVNIAVTETVRIEAEVPIKLVPIKQAEQLMCNPLGLEVAPSGNITLSSSTSRPIVAAIPSNPLVDFAIHATARQPVTN